MKSIWKPLLGSGFCFAILALSAGAQNTFPATGNVGIGWANPSYPLEVNGAALFDTTGGSGNGLTWAMDSGHNGVMPALRSMSQGAGAPGQIESSYFIINGETGGYLGVGTTSPQTMLHVAVPASNGLQWAEILQNPGNSGSNTGVGVGLQFKASAFIYGNPTETNKWSGIAGVPDAGSSYEDFFGLAIYTHNGIGAPPSEVLRIASGGNVGIGTTPPQALLDVNGGIRISGGGAGLMFPDGTVQATAYTGTCVATGGNYAEAVDVTGESASYEPGDIIVIDPDRPGHFSLASEPYSTRVTGIYSTKPGYVGRRQAGGPKLAATEIPMAMIGVVPTKVTTENGPIRAGDLLVTSSRPGYAMKGTDRSQMIGAIVGKALASLNSGTGVIEVVVTLQ